MGDLFLLGIRQLQLHKPLHLPNRIPHREIAAKAYSVDQQDSRT